MEKLDLYKLHKDEYVAPSKPVLVKTKPAKYLTITGTGAPGEAVFVRQLSALYNVAFTIKMAQKAAGREYAVCKLEGLWWGAKGQPDFPATPPETWNWKLLIRTPDSIVKKDLTTAVAALLKKGKAPAVSEVQIETIKEGLCVQMLHVGPYNKEAESIEKMRAFAAEQGLSFHGLHHEIYLSDPRRVAPERLRTILRMPIE